MFKILHSTLFILSMSFITPAFSTNYEHEEYCYGSAFKHSVRKFIKQYSNMTQSDLETRINELEKERINLANQLNTAYMAVGEIGIMQPGCGDALALCNIELKLAKKYLELKK